MKSSLRRILFLAVFLVMVFSGECVSLQAPNPGEQAPAEPPAPKPSPEVQKTLDEASRFANEKKPQQSLEAAERALRAAQQEKDLVGEALAHRSRALALHDLDRIEEAVAAWREAAAAWARADDGPGQIEALAMAGLLLIRGQPAEAEQLLIQALALGKAEANRPLAAARVLLQAAWKSGSYHRPREGHDLFAAALAILEKLAPNSLDAAESLNGLGFVASWQGDLAAARAYHTRALGIFEKLAPESVEVAESLIGLGNIARGQRNVLEDLELARDYHLRAVAILEKLAPNSSSLGALAATLHNLGVVSGDREDFEAARKYYQRALVITEQLRPNSLDNALTLTFLGSVAQNQGDLEGAAEYYQRALAIQEKLAPDSGELAQTLNYLGYLAKLSGDLVQANKYFGRSSSILEKLAPGSTLPPKNLRNLGVLAMAVGDFSEADEYFQRALAIQEKSAPNSLLHARILSSLGSLAFRRGNYTAAGEHLRRALEIGEKLAPESLVVAQSLGNLGEVEQKQGHLSAASEYYQRAFAILEKLAPNSSDMAWTLQYLGDLARLQGDWTAAREYHRRGLALREKILGTDHPEVALSLIELAKLLAETGDATAALKATLRAEKIGRDHLRLTARTLPERQALAYASVRVSSLDLGLTLAAEALRENPASTREVFDALIRSRALVLDEMAARHRTVGEASDPEVSYLAKALASARERLARLVVRGPGDGPPERYQNLLDGARRDKEEAERALAEKSLDFRQEQARSRLGLEDIAAVLPADAVLVAFARYSRYELGRTGVPRNSTETAPSYLAFVLRSGESEPAIVPLGTAKEIEGLISSLREQVGQEAMASGRASKGSETAYRRLAAELRRKVWDPVVSYLAEARRVFVVPDGALHLVNLSALPVGQTKYLIETARLIHYLSSERDLVPMETHAKGEGLLALGLPAFDETHLFAALTPQPVARERAQPIQLAAIKTFRGQRSTCGDFQSMRFEPLPASAREVEEITSLWTKASSLTGRATAQLRGSLVREGGSVVRLTGAQANEADIKQQAPGKRVLHLATHGFFLGGRCTSALESSVKAKEAEISAITGENPLLLAGLALAGANHRDAAGPEEEDGILTAEEIAALDLSGLEWAVLSACDTGVGEVKAGEGVVGLRRAFQVAGVGTVIMSLWPVEDESTMQWMRALYQRRFIDRLNTAEAVWNASLEVLKQRRAKKQSTHPFYWAGFVAAGDWR